MTQITIANYIEEGLLKMKSVPPNPDGTIGVMLMPDMPEWKTWLAYFYGKRMDKKAAFMRSRREKGYMVPCRNPADFDSDIGKAREEYAYRLHMGEIPDDAKPGRMSWEMSSDEIEELTHLVRTSVKTPPKAHKYTAPDMREQHKPLEARPLTDAEAESMKRLLGIREQKAAAE